MSIELLCPSRGRPDAARELLASFRATVTLPSTRLVFLLDDDDPTAGDYPEVRVIAPGDGTPTGPLNRAALASEAAVVGFIGDDSRFATKGWDAEVERAIREPGFAYGPDDTGPPIWPSTAFVTTDIVRAIGYFALPTLKRGFFDRQWISVARGAGVERALTAHFPHDNADHPVSKEVIRADEEAFRRWGVDGALADARTAQQVYNVTHFFPARVLAA